MMCKLAIEYTEAENVIDERLDSDLECLLRKHGFELWASGVNCQTGQRDLAFEKKRHAGSLRPIFEAAQRYRRKLLGAFEGGGAFGGTVAGGGGREDETTD